MMGLDKEGVCGFLWKCCCVLVGVVVCFCVLFFLSLSDLSCLFPVFPLFGGNLPSIVLCLSGKESGFQWSFRHEELFVLFSFYSRLLFCLLVLVGIFVLVSSFYYCLCPLYCISMFALVLCNSLEFLFVSVVLWATSVVGFGKL